MSMIVSVKSLYSSTLNHMDLQVTQEQLEHWHEQGEPLLVAMPNLSADEMQFLLTGMNPAERVAQFGRLAR